MSRYLDPKADLTFKKIFGEHPHILISFLNAILPLADDQQIQSIEYLPSEQVPLIPTLKNTIVDVKCYDKEGRIFIVEIQMLWSDFFKQRMLFNAGKAYVKQLNRGEDYELLKPVYGLALVNQNFDEDKENWYHHYGMVNLQRPNEEAHQIKDLQLIFVEIQKIKPVTHAEKKLAVLWLRFLAEINDKTTIVPPELLAVREIHEAVDLAEESAYTLAELDTYDTYWDRVSTERSFFRETLDKGRIEGETIGLKKGEKIGLKKGELLGKQKIAQAMLTAGLPLTEVMQISGLTEEQINASLS